MKIDQIQTAIDECTNKEDYFLGFIKFLDLPVVLFADEGFNDQELQPWQVSKLKDLIVITTNQNRYQELVNNQIQTIHFPWIHWIYHLISLRKIKQPIRRINNRSKIFNFLNRRWHPGRLHLIEYLFTEHQTLLNTGHITANCFNYYCDHPLLAKDINFLNFYQGDTVPFEKNSIVINNTPTSVNTKNIFYIAENIPGQIYIAIETPDPTQIYHLGVTEKSLIPFVTKQLPILINRDSGFIEQFRAQGLDTFDDIIDQTYDQELDYFKRIEKSVDLNVKILSGELLIPDIEERLTKNQTFLVNQWLDQTLLNLVLEIERLTSM